MVFSSSFLKTVQVLGVAVALIGLTGCKLEDFAKDTSTPPATTTAPAVVAIPEATLATDLGTVAKDLNQSEQHFRSIRKLVEDDGLPKEPTDTNISALKRFIESASKASQSAETFLNKYQSSTLIDRNDGRGVVPLSQLDAQNAHNAPYLLVLETIRDRKEIIEKESLEAQRTLEDMLDIRSRQ